MSEPTLENCIEDGEKWIRLLNDLGFRRYADDAQEILERLKTSIAIERENNDESC